MVHPGLADAQKLSALHELEAGNRDPRPPSTRREGAAGVQEKASPTGFEPVLPT